MEHNNDEKEYVMHGVYHCINNDENKVLFRESIIDYDGDELTYNRLLCGCLHDPIYGDVLTSNDCY